MKPSRLITFCIYLLATVQVLLHLQKGSPEHLLSAYGEWFREIASSGHPSWQDFLLDEVSRPYPLHMAGHVAFSSAELDQGWQTTKES